MKCKMYSPVLVLMLVSIVACAQKKYSLKNVQVFSRVHMPGNIPVNEKGEPLMGPDTAYTIVVEASGKPVEWKTAYTKNKAYLIAATPISNLPYDAGVNDANGKKILITPAKGNQLWLLELNPLEANAAKRPAVNLPTIMLLQGQVGKTTFTHSIQKIINIEMMPVY